MSTAFGIQQTSAGVGTTASDMRHILAAQWACTGVVDGLAVTGSTSLAYSVASGVAVCSRGTSDGKTLAWWPGGNAPAVAASDATNPRIDVVWVTAHDASQGDADNLVTLGVTQGTPAATPVAPTIPTYATQLAQMLMPAGATTTANASQASATAHSVPYGASLGVLLHKVSTLNGVGGASWTTVCSGTVTLTTKRVVRIDTITSAKGVVPNVGTDTDGTMHVRILVDGADAMSWERQLRSAVTAEAMPLVTTLSAGSHTIALQCDDGISGWKAYYSWSSGVQWPGQVLVVTDEGMA